MTLDSIIKKAVIGLSIVRAIYTGNAEAKSKQESISAIQKPQIIHYEKIPPPEFAYKPEHKLPNFSNVQLAQRESELGKLQRTERWKNVIDAVAEKYCDKNRCIKEKLARVLFGIIMEESYGDPVQPNASGDGGLGLVHFQGTTAEFYGLEIFGSSKKPQDFRHGKQIEKMLDNCNYIHLCVQRYDDRANPIFNLDAAARLLMRNYQKTKDWKKAIRKINPGSSVYVERVFSHIDFYKSHRKDAEKYFNKKNKGKNVDGKPLTYTKKAKYSNISLAFLYTENCVQFWCAENNKFSSIYKSD